MRLAAIASTIYVLAFAAIGCGANSGESPTSDSETQLSKASYAKQAQKICQSGLDKRTAAVKAGFAEREKKGLPLNTIAAFKQVLLDDAVPPINRMADELKRLGSPDAMTKQASAMVTAFEGGVRQIETEPAKVLKGADAFGSARKQAKALGIKACSEVF